MSGSLLLSSVMCRSAAVDLSQILAMFLSWFYFPLCSAKHSRYKCCPPDPENIKIAGTEILQQTGSFLPPGICSTVWVLSHRETFLTTFLSHKVRVIQRKHCIYVSNSSFIYELMAALRKGQGATRATTIHPLGTTDINSKFQLTSSCRGILLWKCLSRGMFGLMVTLRKGQEVTINIRTHPLGPWISPVNSRMTSPLGV